MEKEFPKKNITVEYIKKFSGLSHSQIAKKLHEDYPHIFKDSENARLSVRRLAGKLGERNRKFAKTDVIE